MAGQPSYSNINSPQKILKEQFLITGSLIQWLQRSFLSPLWKHPITIFVSIFFSLLADPAIYASAACFLLISFLQSSDSATSIQGTAVHSKQFSAEWLCQMSLMDENKTPLLWHLAPSSPKVLEEYLMKIQKNQKISKEIHQLSELQWAKRPVVFEG